MDRIFDIQEQIARDVVDALKLELEPREKAGIGRTHIDDLSAWRRVILAREVAFQWRPDALERARTLLREALELTGENATICAAMGRVLLHHVEAGTADRASVLIEAQTWEARARAADPDHPETRILSAWLAHVSGNLGRAIDELEGALQSDHDHPDALVLLAHCLLRVGLIDQARPVIDHAIAVDPLTPLTRCFPGYLAGMEGRFDDAVAPYMDMLEADPANPVARLFSVWVHLATGQRDEASALLRGFDGPAADSTPAHIARHLVDAEGGKLDALVLPDPVQNAARGSEMYCRYLAEARALAGDAKTAAYWLEQAVDLGFVNWPYLTRHSPFLRPLADDPALAPSLAKARAAWEDMQRARGRRDDDIQTKR
jgi:tetratricopeptide (TPR) repeat protein